MHVKGGNFCIFLLKIADKEGGTDLIVYIAAPISIIVMEELIQFVPKTS